MQRPLQAFINKPGSIRKTKNNVCIGKSDDLIKMTRLIRAVNVWNDVKPQRRVFYKPLNLLVTNGAHSNSLQR